MRKYLETSTEDFARYLKKYGRAEAMAWVNVVRYYGILIPLIAIGLIVAIVKSSPFPPEDATLAVGQSGSSYADLSDDFTEVLARYGIRLRTEETTGLEQGLVRLNDHKSEVNAAFYWAGSAKAKNYPNLMTLGAFQYAPIWLFYRGETIQTNDPFQYFADKAMAVGSSETVTHRIFQALYDLSSAHSPSASFVKLPHAEAADQLLAGKIDAVFLVDNFNSPTVQRLLADPAIKIMDWQLADAYTKKLPFLEVLTIPAGSVDIDSVKPERNIRILSTHTVILVEKSMHPAVQWAFILAAREISNNRTTFFSKPGYFPRNLDFSFPLSPVAKRYYENGVPQVFSYVPLWLGSIIDNVWVLVLALVAVVYPLFRLIANFRGYPSKKGMYDLFYDLRDIDEQLTCAKSREELESLLTRLEYYGGLNQQTWLAPMDVRFYFTIKNQIANLQKDIRARLEQLVAPESSAARDLKR